jgi:hypothetical protein
MVDIAGGKNFFVAFKLEYESPVPAPYGRGSVANYRLGLHGCFLVEELDESVDVSGER